MKKLAILMFLCLPACESFMTRENVREAEQKRDMNDRVSTLQKSTADVNNRFADIESEQRQLNGRIEVLENRIGVSSAERDKQKKATDDLVVDLQKRTTVMQEEIGKLNDQVAALATEMANARSSDSGGGSKDSGKGAYEVAEELFEKKDYKKAILAYQKFRDSKPKDKRVPDAVLKIAISFQDLGMKEESKTFFEELIAKYPNSAEAKRAKIRLKKLK